MNTNYNEVFSRKVGIATTADLIRRFITTGSYTGVLKTDHSDPITPHLDCVIDSFFSGTYLQEIQGIVDYCNTTDVKRYAFYVLAKAASHERRGVRKEALANLPKFCVTSESLFLFISIVNEQRGWGRALRRAVSEWYNAKGQEALGRLVTDTNKYHGWTHRDVLRMAKPKPIDSDHRRTYEWVVGKWNGVNELPEYLANHEQVKAIEEPLEAARFIRNKKLEMHSVPSQIWKFPVAWQILMSGMSLRYLIDNVHRMSAVCTCGEEVEAIHTLAALRISSAVELADSGFTVFDYQVACDVYNSGTHNELSWSPNHAVLTAFIDGAKALTKHAPAIHGTTCVAVETSQEIGLEYIPEYRITSSEVMTGIVKSVLHASDNDNVVVLGFGEQLTPLAVNANLTMAQIEDVIVAQGPSQHDASLPIRMARENGIVIDNFLIIGRIASEIHCDLAKELRQYRLEINENARVAVVATSEPKEYDGVTARDTNGMLALAGYSVDSARTLMNFLGGK